MIVCVILYSLGRIFFAKGWGQTDTQTDIATYRLNRPSSQIGERKKKKKQLTTKSKRQQT